MSGRGEAREAEWDSSKCSIEPIVNENVGISATIIQLRYEEVSGIWESMLDLNNISHDSLGLFATQLLWYWNR